MSTEMKGHVGGDQPRGEYPVPAEAGHGGPPDFGELHAEYAAVTHDLTKACRRFERERRAIAADDTDSTARAGAELVLRHYVSAEIHGLTTRLGRLVRRFRAVDD